MSKAPEFDLLVRNVRVVRPHGNAVHQADIAITALDGSCEALIEAFARPQQPRVQEAKQHPEFFQAILQRRAGGGDAEIGLQREHGLRAPGGKILDRLSLIQHQTVPLAR